MKIQRLAIVLLLLTCVITGYAQTKPKQVVFVCEHGAGRSLIASRYFEQQAKQEGLKVNVLFKGLSPDPVLGEVPKQGLIKDGFTFKDEKPELLKENDLKRADLIVTLDCELPAQFSQYKSKHLKYTGIPSISDNYAVARDSIKGITQDVLVKLKTKGKK